MSTGSVHDDPESPDAEPIDAAPIDAAPIEPGPSPTGGAPTDGLPRLDVTPRTGGPSAGGADGGGGGRNRSRTYLAVGAVAVVVIALGVVLLNGLQDASTFFYNVDEVAARHDQLQGERIRMQGNVVDGTVHTTSDGVEFVLRFGGREIPVSHVGDPPELFGPKIPVVLEGTLDGDTFHSDQILVRHDSSYDEENRDRIRDAERDAGTATTTSVAPEQGPALGGASG